ncbi:hypothetical protein B0G75_101372 [Paraburkholderia sp. BL18I3N2]|uniref:hypothetical protein n=1 Tax=Paraburkholderia sp. BL18I3N2 TaxID=1938799 RepID=UPI000D06B82A|nr:hypothetical protein [Paraburkholderia sp. BL18I3N2]PRX36183.1 hypothetical protein B0G75_101372 [Paraburkholderia sp. BL18I3N2]
MKSNIIIRDLPRSADRPHDETTLTAAQMKTLRGGRSVVVTVDRGPLGQVDDFGINTAIFEGRIKGPYL